MNEKNNVLVSSSSHNDRFIENGKSLSSNIFRKVVLNHKYQKNIHVAFINSVWFLADCRKIIKHVLSLDQKSSKRDIFTNEELNGKTMKLPLLAFWDIQFLNFKDSCSHQYCESVRSKGFITNLIHFCDKKYTNIP